MTTQPIGTDSNQASASPSYFLLRMSLSIVFLGLVWLMVKQLVGDLPNGGFLVLAAVVGGYMAMNIGANDVANNVGPAVGSMAISMTTAIMIAAIFEAAGALIAGGDVVATIQKGIINPDLIEGTREFEWLMMAALLASALWLNLATWMGAPVSTTHAIVGGVLGAGVAAGGWNTADWNAVGAIASSWVISPIMGGITAAFFLMLIKYFVVYPQDTPAAARRYVPLIIALMVWTFTTYLILKGLNKLINVGVFTALLIGLAAAAIAWFFSRKHVKKITASESSRNCVNDLFTWPLVFSAALLSFAHGANDVANAVGPLAAIHDAMIHNGVSEKASIPLWVMLVGALGISVGLLLFGPRLIRTVGSEITELDKTRAFCIALAAAITVIIASQLGLPVSSTHIALGGVFGVGFLREYLKTSYASQLHIILNNHTGDNYHRIKAFLDDFRGSDSEDMRELLDYAKLDKTAVPLTKSERKRLKKIYKHELVKRQQIYKIAAAWIITVPFSAFLGALIFFALRGFYLP